MRVLMICPELPSASSPNTMAAGARQIQSIRELDIEVEVVDMRGIPKLKYLQVLPKIRRLAKSVDLIHAHFGYCGWLAKLGPLFSRGGKPVVVSFMGDDLLGTPINAAGDLQWLSRVLVRINQRFAPLASEVIVKSSEMARVIPDVQCTVIPNGVDVEVFKPLDRVTCCRELGLPAGDSPDDELLVLFPGDPDNPRKGYQLASEATALAQKTLDRAIRLVPLKRVAADQVAVYMNACHAMLMTSLIEGSPNVVKEAMACDLPVVGVPVGDVHEMLAGVEGCHCTSRDPKEVATALVQILANGSRSSGRAAIHSRRLDLASVAQRVRAVYDRALMG